MLDVKAALPVVNVILQVIEMEKELEPMKVKLQSGKHSTEKFDEKVEEWKV